MSTFQPIAVYAAKAMIYGVFWFRKCGLHPDYFYTKAAGPKETYLISLLDLDVIGIK